MASPDDRLSKIFDYSLMALICLNAFALIVGTVETVYRTAPTFFLALERLSVAVFAVEYILRLWSCTSSPRYPHPLWGRLRFAVSPLLLLDLLAILPFFAGFVLRSTEMDLRSLRAVRIFARVGRLARYSTGIKSLTAVLDSRKNELLTVMAVLLLLLVIASSLMFFAAHEAQPNQFSSIPQAMWWSIITLTTVGYGDVTPVTLAGRVIAGVIAILGIGLFALPAGILGSGFPEELQQRRRERRHICPHCGEELPD